MRKFFYTLNCYLKNIFKKFIENEGLLLSSGIGFAAVICIIPLLLLITSIFGSILNSQTAVYKQIEIFLENFFIAKPYSSQIRTTITSLVDEIISNRQSFSFIAIFTLIWTSTNLFAFTRMSLNRIYKIEKQRSIVRNFFEDVFWVLISLTIFFIVNIVLWMYSIFESFLKLFPFLEQEVIYFTFPFFSNFVTYVLMFFVIYRYIPNERIPIKIALISSVTSASLWKFAGVLFSLYLSKFSLFGSVYGAYAFLLSAFIWVYYSCITFLVGAEVGQIYKERSSNK